VQKNLLDVQDGQPSNIVNINETNNLNQSLTEIIVKEVKVNQDNVTISLTNELNSSDDTLKNANEINKSKQRILVCVGVPGSGKSTFSKKLCQIDNVSQYYFIIFNILVFSIILKFFYYIVDLA